jgi:outer membrane protein assembly factor BamB
MVFIGATDNSVFPWDHYMMAFYQNNGTRVWRTETLAQVAGGEGFSSSPAYSNGYVVFGGDRIYCLYANNGTIKWTVWTGNGNWGDGTPTIADGKVFIGGSDWNVYNIDLETGNVLWTFQTGTGGSSNWGLYPAPAIYNGHVYASAGDGYVYQIRIDQPGPTAAANHSFNSGFAMYSSPVIYNNRVYVGNGYNFLRTANRFYCLSATDLSLIWQFYPGSSTSFMSSAGIAYNTVFISSHDGNLYALDPVGSGGSTSVIWQYTIGSSWSSPAISDGQIFIGSKWGYLYAFNASQPGPPSYKWRYDTGGIVDSSPAIADGLAFVGTRGGGGSVIAFGQTGDLTPPQAVSYSPFGPGADINANIVVEWSETMDWASVENSFSFTDSVTTWYAGDGTFFHFPPSNTSTFDPSFSLDWGTTYYVTFSAAATDVAGNPLDGNGDGTGGDDLTWPFSTVPDTPPVLSLWEPGGSAGQTYTVGEVITIIWSASDDKPWPNSDNVVNLSYGPTPAGGTPIAQYELEDGNHPWDTAPVAPGTYYVEINVFDSIGQVTSTSSSNSFEILATDSPPSVSVWEPGGTPGQSFTVGSPVLVLWTATDDNAMPANNINVTYGSGMTWNDVVRDTANDGTRIWDTTGVTPGNYYVNVSAYDSAGQTSWDLSNFTFEIASVPNLPPTASVLQPAGGEVRSGGSTLDIVWIMSDDITPDSSLTVYLNYSYLSGGGSIAGPLTGLTGPMSHPWTLPPIDATDVVVEIEVIDEGGEVGSDSSLQFEVDSIPPTVLWTNPLDGESGVARSTNVEAQWSEGMNQTATESSFQLFANSTWLPATGTFSWVGDDLIFDPDADLAGDEWYTANITTAAKDDSEPGNPLASLYSWSFRTSPVPDVLPPEITDVQATPSPQEVHFSVNVSAMIADDFSVGVVSLNVSGPSGDTNDSMLFDIGSGRYYVEKPYDETGVHSFVIWAYDSSGNANSSSGQFIIEDTIRPTLEDLTIVPLSPEVFSIVNVSVLVLDNYELFDVWIDIPGTGNFTMAYDPIMGKHYHEALYIIPEFVSFSIWANDTSDNWNGTSGNFLVEDRTAPVISHSPFSTWSAFSPLTIQATVTDSFLDQVRLDYTDVGSASYNVTMSPAGVDIYEYTIPAQMAAGTLTYFVWANDTSDNVAATSVFSVNILLDDNPPGIADVDASPNPQEIFGDVNISARVVDDYGIQSVSVALTWPDSSVTNVSMNPALGDFYYFGSTYDQLGYYAFTIWARDSSNRWDSSVGSFGIIDSTLPIISHSPIGSQDIGEAINFTASVTDNFLVGTVRVNYTDTSGIPHSELMSIFSGDEYFFFAGIQAATGNVNYSFWAEDSSGNQVESPAYTLVVTETRPRPPENLTIVASLESSFRLEWGPPTRNVDGSQLTDLMGYNLYRRADPSDAWSRMNLQLIQGTSFFDTDLGPGETYYYVVRAVNSRGLESDNSNVASGTTPESEESDYFTIIAALLIIVIIAVIILLLLLRRRKADDEEPEGAESRPPE